MNDLVHKYGPFLNSQSLFSVNWIKIVDYEMGCHLNTAGHLLLICKRRTLNKTGIVNKLSWTLPPLSFYSSLFRNQRSQIIYKKVKLHCIKNASIKIGYFSEIKWWLPMLTSYSKISNIYYFLSMIFGFILGGDTHF